MAAKKKKARQGAAQRSPSRARLAHSVTDDLDRTPVAMPVGWGNPTPLHVLLARAVREAIQEEKNEAFETLEEADDFEEEDPELLDMSPYTFTDTQSDYTREEIQEFFKNMEESPQPPSEAPQETTVDRPDPDGEETDQAVGAQ